MTRKTFFALLTILILTGCGNARKQAQTISTTSAWEVQADSIEVKNKNGRFLVEIDRPVNCSSTLGKLVMEYANESLGDTYTGDLSDTKAMMQHYIDTLVAEYGDYEGPEAGSIYYEVRVKKAAETPKFLTFRTTTDSYLGGAHGMTTTTSATFRKDDGRRMDWSATLRSGVEYEFDKLVKAGLKEYFDVHTDQELASCLLVEADDTHPLPLPVSGPVFGNDGITLSYQPYEIAPYSAGAPTFAIPLDKLRPYLSTAAADFFAGK